MPSASASTGARATAIATSRGSGGVVRGEPAAARGVDARRERRGQRGVEHAGGVARVRFDEAQRRAQRARRVGQRVLGDAPRGRDDGRERERREIMRGERGGDARGKRRQIRRRGARGRRRVRAGATGGIGRRDAARVVAQALAVDIPIAIAQRDDDAARMDQQRVRVATRRMRRDADHARRVRVARQRDIVEPARIAFDARAFAREQIGHEALARVEIGERVAFGRVQHARAEAQFAARRDRGRDAERVGDLARERVGAREAAQQRHDRAAVLGDGEHGRLRALVGEARRDAANRDAGREQRDDRRAARIQLAQMRAELGEREVRLGAPGERVHPRAVEARLDPARGLERARPEYHDRGRGGHPCHFSPARRAAKNTATPSDRRPRAARSAARPSSRARRTARAARGRARRARGAPCRSCGRASSRRPRRRSRDAGVARPRAARRRARRGSGSGRRAARRAPPRRRASSTRPARLRRRSAARAGHADTCTSRRRTDRLRRSPRRRGPRRDARRRARPPYRRNRRSRFRSKAAAAASRSSPGRRAAGASAHRTDAPRRWRTRCLSCPSRRSTPPRARPAACAAP